MQNTLPSNIKAALIDMDGVLYDSMPRHARAWRRMMGEIGIDLPADEFFLYEGMTGIATIRMLLKREKGVDVTDAEARELYSRKARYFVEQGGAPIMSGATEAMRALCDAGIECVLVTGSGQASLIDRISHDFPGVFSEEKMVTAHNVSHGKPHPEPYLRGLELSGQRREDVIVIENAPLGVEAGKSAGLTTIAVATGPIPREKLSEAGADIVLPSMNELATLISTRQ